jgi:hypothetical protein
MERLFLATLVVRYDGHPDRDIGARIGVATQYDLWWNARDPRPAGARELKDAPAWQAAKAQTTERRSRPRT